MIKLFITDLDGCISTPFSPPDWALLSQIRQLNEQHRSDRTVPPLTICSGRPLSYVEAVGQWLNILYPVAVESAGIYTLEENEGQFLPAFNQEAQQTGRELNKWLRSEIRAHHPGTMLGFTNKMDAGLIHPNKEVIDEIFPEVNTYVRGHYPHFEAHNTEVSITISLTHNNKRKGIL